MKRVKIFIGIVVLISFTTAAKRPFMEKWMVTTIAGVPHNTGTVKDGTGASAVFFGSMGFNAIDAADNLYILDQLYLRVMDNGSKVTTWFGGESIDENNKTITTPPLAGRGGICTDDNGNIYITNHNDHAIYKISADKKVTLFAGQEGYRGNIDGPRLQAAFKYPRSICRDKSGNMYVADIFSIRKISTDGTVTTLAGEAEGGDGKFKAGVGKAAVLLEIRGGIAVDSKGNVYVPQNGMGGAIAKISASGDVSIFAGDLDAVPPDMLNNGTDEQNGTGTTARFMRINALAVDKEDNLIIAEESRVRKATPSGVVTTIAGTVNKDFVDGKQAAFTDIHGISIDSKGNLLVSDEACIRKISKQ
ncbi:MAG: hypothetical protein QM687_06260 [Ferruginibacter sp.]